MPMDQRLERAHEATVRVNGGSGVILQSNERNIAVIATARHVVGDGAQATIRWSAGMHVERVLATNAAADIALVDVPRDLEGRGLVLADCEIAEEVWLMGFPGGWAEAAALVSKGTVAGLVGTIAWVDGSPSWGHSGGPVLALRDDAVVVGTIVGAAGRVHHELEEMIRLASEEQDLVERIIAERVRLNRTPEAELGLMGHSTTRVRQALELIRSHFRAGFIGVARSDELAALRG
jgi:hypothetical protein